MNTVVVIGVGIGGLAAVALAWADTRIHYNVSRAISAAVALYRAILDDIEEHDYDVFTRRARGGDTVAG